MPANEKFFEQLKDRLSHESDRKIQDKLLDLWLATVQMATEWDAKQWKLDEDKEIKEVLYMIAQLDKSPRKVRRSQPE
jgi:hypothetical protein